MVLLMHYPVHPLTMRKIGIVLASFLVVPLLASAQSSSAGAGITPESPFYFLDQLFEQIQEVLTFSPESKAHLHITLAAERVAEIRVILETKGVEAPGIETARQRLDNHLQGAADILVLEKAKGKDVSVLARELDGEIEISKAELEDAFEQEKKSLESEMEALKADREAARKASDMEGVNTFTAGIETIKTEMKMLEVKKAEIDDDVAEGESEIEDADANGEDDEDKDTERMREAQKQIKEAEMKQLEVVNEMRKEGTPIEPLAFEKFDRLIAQAKELFKKGNYQGAEQLAKQAKTSLEEVKRGAEKKPAEQEQQGEAGQRSQEPQSDSEKKTIEDAAEAEKKAQEGQR